MAASDEQQFVQSEGRRLRGKALACYLAFAIISISIFIGIAIFFFSTNYDLTKDDTYSVLFTNRLIRIVISIASLSSSNS